MSTSQEPIVALQSGRVLAASLDTSIRLRAYAIVGGIIAQRGWRGARWLRRQTIDGAGPEFTVVELAPDARFRFRTRDFYWNRLLLQGYVYEAPLAALLKRLAPHDYTFIDCGANLGYWSVVASSDAFGSKWAVAIEPMADNFGLLERNCALNAGRFTCLKRAIHSKPGVEVQMFGAAATHFGASLRPDWHGEIPQYAEPVLTTTIDAVARQFDGQKLVVKLDVEGVECEAIAGAAETLTKRALLIYEDHPRDVHHAPTTRLLEHGLVVHLLGERGMTSITNAAQLTREKMRADYEYNLVAYAPGSWCADLLE